MEAGASNPLPPVPGPSMAGSSPASNEVKFSFHITPRAVRAAPSGEASRYYCYFCSFVLNFYLHFIDPNVDVVHVYVACHNICNNYEKNSKSFSEHHVLKQGEVFWLVGERALYTNHSDNEMDEPKRGEKLVSQFDIARYRNFSIAVLRFVENEALLHLTAIFI